MKFPNAFSGVKKIYTAEILDLIAALATLVAAVLAVVAAGAANAESVGGALASLAGTAILGVASMVLGILALIFMLIGLSAAGKDEPKFKKALIFAVLSLAASVLSSVFSGNEFLKNLMPVIAEICDLAVIILVIQGIVNLAKQLTREDMEAKGASILKLIVCVLVLSIIARAILLFTPTLSLIMALVAAVLDVIRYFIYLSYLKKSKAMLEA